MGWGRRGSELRVGRLALSRPRRVHTSRTPPMRQCGGSQYRLPAPVSLPLLSRHYSTAPPSPKRYEVESSRTPQPARRRKGSSTAFRWAHASWDNAGFGISRSDQARRRSRSQRGALATCGPSASGAELLVGRRARFAPRRPLPCIS
jgi:hypothetical protein